MNMKKVTTLIVICLVAMSGLQLKNSSAVVHLGGPRTYQMVRVSDGLIAVMDTRTSRIKTIKINRVIDVQVFTADDRKLRNWRNIK